MLQRPVLRPGIGAVGLVGDVVDLRQQPQSLGRAAGEVVAELQVGDVLADHVAQRASAVKIADLADEVRTPALADAGLETATFVVRSQAEDAFAQAGEVDRTAADTVGALGVAHLDAAAVETAAGDDAEATQCGRQQVERQRRRQLHAAELAALAIEWGGERPDRLCRREAHPRPRHVAGDELREVVVVVGLRVDVALQLLVVAGRRHVGAGAEVLLVGHVQCIGTPRVDLRVAAAGAGPAGGFVDAEVDAGAQLVNLRPRHLLGGTKAQRLVAAQVEGQVQGRQHVGVGLAVRDRLDLAARCCRAVEIVAVRRLVDTLGLQAEVAAHRHGAELRVEVGLGIQRGDLFLHVPGLGDQVVGRVAGGEGHVARHGARHVPGRDAAHACKAQVDEAALQVGRDGGVALRTDVDVAFGLTLLLRAVGVIQAEVDVGHEAADGGGQRQVAGHAKAAQFVLHAGHLAVARAVDGVAQEELGRVVVGAAGRHGREVVTAEAQRQVVVGRCGHQLGVVLKAEFVALGNRVAEVGGHRHVTELEAVVPAVGADGVLALVVHATHERIDAADVGAGHGRIAVDDRVAEGAGRVAGEVAVVLQVHFPLVGGRGFLGGRCEQVQCAGPFLEGPEFDGGHHAVAGALAGAAQGLDAVGDPGAVGQARAVGVAAVDLFPGLVGTDLFFLHWRFLVRIANDQANRAAGELVNVADAQAVAVGGTAGRRAQRIARDAAVDGDLAAAEVQRPDGLHVDRARQALPDQRCVGRLEDDHAAEQFRRVLVKLDAAVVTRGHQFAAVEQGGREVWRQAAHADDLRAPGDALRREARQPGDGFGDAVVGQLADVFGRDRLDDVARVLLDVDGAFDAAPDAGDGDGFCRRRLGLRDAAGAQGQGGCGGHGCGAQHSAGTAAG